MKTIAIYSHKGGTGKTTSTFNIAGILARDYKKKVLCIDCDPQANLTAIMLMNEIEANDGMDYLNTVTTVEDLFLTPEKVNEAIRPVEFSLTEKGTPKRRGIDIIPARPISLGLKKNLEHVTKLLDSEVLDKGQLKYALTMIRRTRSHLYDYDYCLIDFPPAANSLTRDVLSAADYVLVPTTMDKSAKDGIATLFSIVSDVQKETGADIKILGIVPATFDKRLSYDSQSLETLKDFKYVIDTPIRTSTDVKWASELGIPLAYNRKTAPVTRDYKKLVEVILQKMGDA